MKKLQLTWLAFKAASHVQKFRIICYVVTVFSIVFSIQFSAEHSYRVEPARIGVAAGFAILAGLALISIAITFLERKS